MQKTLFIKSFGCQMNEYDSAKIADIMATFCGFSIAKDYKTADLIILNTCYIRAKATEKIFSELGRLRSLKKKNPNLILAVGGCVSVQEKNHIFSRVPYVDIVFAPQTLHRLPEMYKRACNKEKRIIDITPCQIEKFDYLPPPTTTGPVACISIIEGCNKYCSYCIVPYARGIEASRKIPDILSELQIAVEKGAKEVNLLGQNVNAYCDPIKNMKLADLIYEVAKIEPIERIRYTTSHPAEFGDDLIAAYKDVHKLTNHLHLPIQSGSNRILKLMRRGYTVEEYQEIVIKLRKIRPNLIVSTDIIVGFPNETEEDFAATMEVVKKVNFDASFSFIYSPRPNTPAAKMIDNVPLAQKKERLFTLQNQLTIQARQYSKIMVGTIQKVLVTNRNPQKPSQFSGRTENNRLVNFTSNQNVLGKMVKIKITEGLSNSLRGEVLVE